MRTRLLVLPLALLLLGGCASNPETEVRGDVRAVLAAANDEDPGAVRSAVDDLLATLRTQVGAGNLTDAQAQPVRDAALAIRDSVAALEVEQTPSPTPPPTPEPTEEPTPSPTPTPTPTPSPTPEPTEEPEQTEPPQTQEPAQSPEPTEASAGDGEQDRATVVPQQPAFTSTPIPTPTATPTA